MQNAKCKMQVWTLSHELADGDYTVDFTAYGKNKDSVTGNDFPDIENAKMGFTVDTNAPALSIKKSALETLATQGDTKIVSQFGSNVVFADEDGNFTIEGVTDYSATLTADGNAVETGNNGVFAYNGKIPEGETSKQIVLKAVDKAGNETELQVFAVIKDQAVIETVRILVNGEAVKKNDDGEAIINIKNGDKATLSLMGYAADGTEVAINDPVWEILYEKNLVEFNDGIIVAKQLGETAIKAGISNGSVTLTDSSRADMLTEDYVIVNIVANSKNDLYEAITEAEENIKDPQLASSTAVSNYQAAINAAKEVYNDAAATEDEIESATTALKKATNTFNLAKSGVSSGGGSARKTYTVKVEETENGTVTVSQNTVYSGNSLTITAVPNEGYEVEDVVVNNVSYGANEITTIASVMESLVVSVEFRVKWDNPFVDVAKSDWFYTYVRWAHENGIMNGTEYNVFSPDEALTRAMLVTILWRAEGEPAAGESGFDDVAADSYYAKAVAWAEANGIVNGYSATEFGPDDNILREQIAAIMYRYAAYKGYDVTIGENTDLSSYEDAQSISEYAIPAMQYAIGSGLIKGKSDTVLDPVGNATRAESATILQRFVDSNK